MILEVVISQIIEGKEAEFEEAHKKGSQILARATGYLGNELRRCVETKGRYINLVRWETVDDHMVGFRGSPEYQEFRALISPFYAAPTQMEHYELGSTRIPPKMILEFAILNVKAGQEQAFEAAFAQASSIIASMRGYIRHELQRSLETESRYLLLVQWETLQDHTVGFRGSEGYQKWKRLLHHFYDPFPVVEHFEGTIHPPNEN